LVIGSLDKRFDILLVAALQDIALHHHSRCSHDPVATSTTSTNQSIIEFDFHFHPPM
jgi:hypothetical protein